MKHVWTVLCQGSVIDQQSNNLSINNCIETLKVSLEKKMEQEVVVTLPLEYQMVSYWKREQGEDGDVRCDLRLEIRDPRNISLATLDSSFTAKKEVKRVRNRWTIQGLQVSISGDYVLAVLKKTSSGEYGLIAELPLAVIVEYK